VLPSDVAGEELVGGGRANTPGQSAALMGGVGDFSVPSRSFLYIFHLDVPWPGRTFPASLSLSLSLLHFTSKAFHFIFLTSHPPTNDAAARNKKALKDETNIIAVR
jgi:hypothetical protein